VVHARQKNMKLRNGIIAIVEMILGTILLMWEVHQMSYLYSIHDPITEVADFFKYKEQTYSLAFLWTILLITGLSYWINKKLNWILTQVLIIMISVNFLWPFVLHSSNSFFVILVTLLIIIGIVLLEINEFKPKVLKEKGITRISKMIALTLGLFLSIVYWTIKLKVE